MKQRSVWVRLFFRFAIANAVVLAILILANLGTIRRAQRQSRAVARVESIGGSVTYEFPAEHSAVLNWIGPDYQRTVAKIDLSYSSVTDGELRSIVRDFPELTWLGLFDTNITDEGLTHVGKLQSLEFLWLDKTKITDDGIPHLQSLPRLRKLLLQYTSVGDESMATLAKISTLQELALAETHVTDVGVRALRPLKLTSLKLDGTAITDASAATLTSFTGLQKLDIFNTSVSDHTFEAARNWRSLTLLRCHDTQITDAVVPKLAKIKTLRAVTLNGEVSEVGVRRLEKTLPSCTVYHSANK